MATRIVGNFLHRSLFATFMVVLGLFANTLEMQASGSMVYLHTQSKMLPVIRVSEGALLDSEFIGNQLKLAELLDKPQLDNLESDNQQQPLPNSRPNARNQKSGNQAYLGVSPATSVDVHLRKEYLLTLSPEATKELDKRARERAFQQEYTYQNSVHEAVIQHTDYKKIYANVIEDKNSKNDYTAPWWLHDSIEHRCAKRIAAIEQRMKDQKEVFSLQRYTPPVLHADFEKHGLISSNHVQALYGNHLQQVIHQEFIDVLQEASDLYSTRSLHSFDKELVLSTVRFAEVGVAMNRYGRIEKAMAVSDFCHAAMAYTNLYLKAFHQGVVEGGGKRLKHIIQNPVEFCGELVTGPFVLARLLGKATYWVAEQAYNDPRGGYKKAIEKGTRWLDAAQEYYDQHSGPEMVQDGVVIASSLAVDFFLAHKCISGLSWMHRTAQTHKSKMIPLLKRLQTTNQQVAAIAGNEQILLITAQDATAILKAENAGSTMITVTDQVMMTGHSGKAEPATNCLALADAEKTLLDSKKLKSLWEEKVLFSESTAEARNSLNATVKLTDSKPGCFTHPITGEKITPGFPPKAADHILFPSLIIRSKDGKTVEKVYGFHHDYMGLLEKTARLSFVKQTPGPYETYFVEACIIDGKTFGPGKSFFPKTMARQAVVDNIWDVLKNGTIIKVQNNGTLVIKGIGRSNIEIVCITNKDGKIITAYPHIDIIKK